MEPTYAAHILIICIQIHDHANLISKSPLLEKKNVKKQKSFRVGPSTSNALNMCSRKPTQTIKAHVIQYFFDINR